jgi:uncharacterized membrane protein
MKKIIRIFIILIVLCISINNVFAWVNEDISKSINVEKKFNDSNVKAYLNTVLNQLKSEFYDNNTDKDWISEINFRIDKEGNVYSKNYVIENDKWVQPKVEDAMLRLNKVGIPPKEYNQELIFVTFEHKNKQTQIYFSKEK